MPTPAAGHGHPSILLPPSFADFKFSVIGQPPQLLKRMGATPPPDFRHSPTPVHMDLQYPPRAEAPWASANHSQPSLQQRLDSADSSTVSNSDGPYLPMDHSDHLTEKTPVIDPDTLITSAQPSSTQQTTLNNLPICHESRARPTLATSSSITRATPDGQLLNTTLTPASSMDVSETHYSSKSQLVQIQSDVELSYKSALIAFEKAERSLTLAQETYDAAKATLIAVVMIRTRLPQLPITDAHQQHTSEGGASRSITTLNDQDMIDAADPIIAGFSGDVHPSQTVPMSQKQPIQGTHHPARHFSTATLTAEKKAISRRMTEIEREADDVRLAWSSLSGQKSSTTPDPTRGLGEHSFFATESHIRSSLRTSADKSPRPPTLPAGPVAEPTIIVKGEDITDADDHQRPGALGREIRFLDSSSLSGNPRPTDSSPSHISIDRDADRTTLALVSESSRLVNDVQSTRATPFPPPTGMQNTSVIVNSGDRHVPKATSSVPRGSPANPIDLDDTAEDEELTDSSGRARSQSIPISLGEDINNALQVERELEKEDSVPLSPPSSSRVSRSSSTQPMGIPDDTVGEGVSGARPTLSSRPEQNINPGSITNQGSKSELYRSSALLPSSPQGDDRSTTANTLLQRLQTAPAASLSEISEPQPKSVTDSPSSLPSVLGKRRHLDPPSPKTRPTAASPFKRRHFTDTQPHDSPSLESRISEASTASNEPERSNLSTSPTFHRSGYTNPNNKNNFVPRNKYIPPAERSISPPSGPRAIRQESVYPYGPGPRKKYVQARPVATSTYDKPLGTGRGGLRLGQHRVTDSHKDNVASPRSIMRAPPPPSERRNYEQISLVDRLRDP